MFPISFGRKTTKEGRGQERTRKAEQEEEEEENYFSKLFFCFVFNRQSYFNLSFCLSE
jgi:hypothetical protein